MPAAKGLVPHLDETGPMGQVNNTSSAYLPTRRQARFSLLALNRANMSCFPPHRRAGRLTYQRIHTTCQTILTLMTGNSSMLVAPGSDTRGFFVIGGDAYHKHQLSAPVSYEPRASRTTG